MTGPMDLANYLDKAGQTAFAFAKEHRLDSSKLYKLLRGEGVERLTIHVAFAIEDATDGEVKARAWL